MKRLVFGILAMLVVMGCGGGNGDGKTHDVILASRLPQQLAEIPDNLAMLGKLEGGESVAHAVVASADASYDVEMGAYSFALTEVPDLSGDEAMFRIEFSLPVSSGGNKSGSTSSVVIASLEVSFDVTQNPFIIDVGDDAYAFDMDDDGDGLSNIAEFMANLNPLLGDSDGDGIQDGSDNCPSVSNSNQDDFDSDGLGDACDDSASVHVAGRDSDGDGVDDGQDNCPNNYNADQADRDGDGKGDACDGDVDGDGVGNAGDNCAEAVNRDQANVDGDGLGDVCDEDIDGDGLINPDDDCPYVANPAQSTVDADSDGVFEDCDLDETDSRVGDAQSAVFVDIAHGDDSSFGTKDHPLASLNAAIVKARGEGKDVFVAAGVYSTDALNLYDGVDMFGGFKNSADQAERFSGRDVRSTGADFRTVLTTDQSDMTLHLEGISLVIDGFHIVNEAGTVDPVFGARTVVVGNGSNVTLDRNTVLGNATALRSTAVRAEYGASLTFTRNLVDGQGVDAPGSASLGLDIDGSQVTLLNNVIKAGSARFVTGLAATDSDPLVVNNTIDGSSGADDMGMAEGVRLENSNPVFANNFIFTSVASGQYVLSCFGDMDASAELKNNLFAAFPADVEHVLIRDCDGQNITSTNFVSDFSMGGASVSSNMVYFASNTISDLVSQSDYALTGGGGSDGVDDGLDASGENFGSIVDDFTTKTRAGAYDIGAMEK